MSSPKYNVVPLSTCSPADLDMLLEDEGNATASPAAVVAQPQGGTTVSPTTRAQRQRLAYEQLCQAEAFLAQFLQEAKLRRLAMSPTCKGELDATSVSPSMACNGGSQADWDEDSERPLWDVWLASYERRRSSSETSTSETTTSKSSRLKHLHTALSALDMTTVESVCSAMDSSTRESFRSFWSPRLSDATVDSLPCVRVARGPEGADCWSATGAGGLEQKKSTLSSVDDENDCDITGTSASMRTNCSRVAESPHFDLIGVQTVHSWRSPPHRSQHSSHGQSGLTALCEPLLEDEFDETDDNDDLSGSMCRNMSMSPGRNGLGFEESSSPLSSHGSTGALLRPRNSQMHQQVIGMLSTICHSVNDVQQQEAGKEEQQPHDGEKVCIQE